MADVSDSRLAEAYQDVRNDSTPTNWFVGGYDGPAKIVFQAKGSDGFSGFADALKDNECQYGFVRFTTGDEESKRAKFVFISWAGPSSKALARAKMSVHKANVKDVLRDFAVEPWPRRRGHSAASFFFVRGVVVRDPSTASGNHEPIRQYAPPTASIRFCKQAHNSGISVDVHVVTASMNPG